MSLTRRCPICVSEYDSILKRPLVLDCGHTFCHECLYHMTDSTFRTCAVCRKSWSDRGVNDLPECYQLLPSDVSSEALHCRPHNSQQLFWCLVCKEKLCRKCLRQQHRACDWVLIEEQAEDLKAEVIGKISETEAKIKDSLASIDNIIKENKTILDLYKNLRKVLGKMNGEYTIYQQRILLLQSKLNRQTTELENLRTDWVIPPGSDLMYAVKEKLSGVQGVEAVIVWPERPHMRCFNGLIDNFQRCRDSNYTLTDVCEGLDLPLTDEESEADDDDENEEDLEDVDQEQEQEQEHEPEQEEEQEQEQEQEPDQEPEHEQESGEEEEEGESANTEDSGITAIETVSSANPPPEIVQFLPSSAAGGLSTMSSQVSSESTSDATGAETAALISRGSEPQQSWLSSPLLGESSRSVSTQFSIRPIFSFFPSSSTQACPFPVSTNATQSVETASLAEASAAQHPTSNQQQQTSTSSEFTLGSQKEQSRDFSTMFGIEKTKGQSTLSFSTLFAPARQSDNVAVGTSVAGPFCSLLKPFPEVCRSSSLPKFPFSSQVSQSLTTSSLFSMTRPSSKLEGNIFQNYSPAHGSLFSCGFGANTNSPAPVVSVTSNSTFYQPGTISEQDHTDRTSSPGVSKSALERSSCSHMNTQAVFTTANNGAESAGTMSPTNVPQSQPKSEAAVTAPTTTVFATFKFQPTQGEVKVSPSHKIFVLDGKSTTTTSISCQSSPDIQFRASEGVPSAVREPGLEKKACDLTGEVQARLRLESNCEAGAGGHVALSGTGSDPSRENRSNSAASGALSRSSAFHSAGTQEMASGETSTLATENFKSAKKVHLQAAVYEDNSESSGDSASSSPRTDTLSRDVTDEDSVRGQMRVVQSSDLMRAFKKAMKELRRLKRSLKGSKSTKTKKGMSVSVADLGGEPLMANLTSTATSSDAAAGACWSSVRPKQVARDAACSPARDCPHPPPTASPRSPPPEDEEASKRHKTLYSEHRKYLRRGGPFRRRLRDSARSCARVAAASSRTT